MKTSIKWCLISAIVLSCVTFTKTKNFQCVNSKHCSCTINQAKFEFQCPFDNPRLTIDVRPLSEVNIQCTNLTEWDINSLPTLEVGDVEYFMLSMCPLPKNGFFEIMNKFGVNQTRTFRFDYSELENTTLTHHFFDKMIDIEKIRLDTNDIKYIDNDVFENMTKLIEIDFKSNKILPNAELFQHTPNLEILDFAKNDLEYLPVDIFKYIPKLRILHLWKNNLTTLDEQLFQNVPNLVSLDLSSNHIQTLPEEIFYPLTHLKEINLISNELSKIPYNLFVKNVEMKKIRLGRLSTLSTLPDKLFANLPQLNAVHLCDNSLKNLSANLFSGSNNLETISLQRNKLEYLPEALFENLTQLKELDLSYNKIEALSDQAFSSLVNLKILNLQSNKITHISQYLLNSLENLKEINFEENLISTIHLHTFTRTANLVKVNFGYNYLSFAEFDRDFYISPFNFLTELEELYLNNNNITSFFDDWMMNKVSLKTIDLSYNQISFISFNNLQKVSRYRLKINLSHNQISTVDLRNAEASAKSQNNLDAYSSNSDYHSVVLLGDNPIVCDCKAYDLVKYFEGSIDPRVLTLIQLVPDGLACAEPPNFKDVLVEQLHTNQLTCTLEQLIENSTICPENCDCIFRLFDKAFIVDCVNKNLSSVPRLILPTENFYNQTEVYLQGNSLTSGPEENMGYENVTRLYLSDNKISHMKWLPPKIEVLQIENNNISSLNQEVLSFLNASTTLTNISLHNNPWICDCSAANFTNFLREHLVLKQVNANNITCRGDRRLLVNLSMKDLCPTSMGTVYILIIAVVVFFMVIAILVALYYCYQQEIKVWLFAHNLFLRFVTEEEIDKDKLFDAFISFSHKDEDFVVNELLPTLEQGRQPYKLCLHFRDWIAGEFIPKQIARSVEDSRRTLVVLSPNFLESVWGKMEFRTAHTQAMSEGRARVIVVLYGDIDLSLDLDEELKAYLKTNTYVKWGDPWFWDKLRYALPHSKVRSGKKVQRNNNIMISLNDKLDLMNAPITPNLGTTPPVICLDPLLLKSNPLDFTPNGVRDTPPAEAGLSPLLNKINVQCVA